MCKKCNVLLLDSLTRKNYEEEKEFLCPFCDLNELMTRDNFKDYGDGILFFANKFNVYDDTCNYLLLEGEDCNIGLHDRSDSHILKVLNTAIDMKNELLFTKDFEEVVIFKQYGFFSSSSVKHGHIQIVGFNNKKSDDTYLLDSLNGIILYDNDNLKVSLSINPIGELMEINIEYEELSIELIKKLKSILNYIVENSYGAYDGGNYSVSLHNIDNIKFIKVVEKKVTTTYKSNFGISVIHKPVANLIKELKSLF